MNNETITSELWLIVAHSAIGLAHIKKNLPCQDAHYHIQINADTGIAVVCDGAGSAAESQIGAKLVSEQTAKAFKREMEVDTWQSPLTQESWQEISYEVLFQIKNKLNELASF